MALDLEDELLQAQSIVDWTKTGEDLYEGHFADRTHRVQHRHSGEGNLAVDTYTWTTPDTERHFISLEERERSCSAGLPEIPELYAQARIMSERRKVLSFPHRP